MTGERLARWTFGLIAIGLPIALLAAWRLDRSSGVSLHGWVSDAGGWQPAVLEATVGVPLELRMISEDVVHSFAIGRTEMDPIELPPGVPVAATLIFTRPGTYTYYCTRWCGADHWRMRGVIEVGGPGEPIPPPQPALYLSLGIDLDAERPAPHVPSSRPSPARGDALGIPLPEGSLTRRDFITRSPGEIWETLRQDSATVGLSDPQVWDLVAFLWRSTTTTEALEAGRELYEQDCAACHGQTGRGDGPMAEAARAEASHPTGHGDGPADFTDPRHMLGASSALLQGKIVRGGMGTGMPYWGPILTEAQSWAVTDFLWTFQFEEGS